MLRPDIFWYILGIYLVYTNYIRITKRIYQVYTLYMTCYVDICTHGAFLHAKVLYVSYIPGIFLVYTWNKWSIQHWMCALRHCRNECLVGVIVGVVLGFQTAKGATDMPTGCNVWRLPLRRSASERSSERDSGIGTHDLTLTPTQMFYTLSVFSSTSGCILAALNPPCGRSWFGRAGVAALRWQNVQMLINWQQRYEYTNRHWSDCIKFSQQVMNMNWSSIYQQKWSVTKTHRNSQSAW